MTRRRSGYCCRWCSGLYMIILLRFSSRLLRSSSPASPSSSLFVRAWTTTTTTTTSTTSTRSVGFSFTPDRFNRRTFSLGLAPKPATSISMTVMMSEQQRVLPQPPYQYRSLNPTQLDLNDNVGRQISTSEQLRQTAYDLSRKVQIATSSARSLVEQHGVVPNNDKGNSNDQETAMMKIVSALQEALAVGNESYSTDGDDAPPSSSSLSDRTPRLANLSNRVEDVVRLLAMMKFLETGDWLSPSECIQRINANHASEATTMTMRIDVTDEEYLAGACMGLCQDLQRYGLGRATARDVASVEAAAALVRRILEYLMQFDFRNGYLRRKYDGTKYALKTLETVLYELSVTGATVSITSANTSDSDGGRPAKKIRTEDSGTDALDTNTNGTTDLKQELDGLRSRIDHRDQLRETLIKRCRDGQKAAKQAIYALHRGDARKAFDLIKECEKCIVNDLLPIVDEEPPLRSGSFANVLEEYAEAKLFYGWLLGKEAIDIDPPKHSENRAVEKANGALLMPEDFTGVVSLLPEEYLGGLCDLTGEIGRYAVQRGTTRDEDGVRDCLEANTAVYEAIQSLERTPNGIGKKLDQLRRSVEKIERMLYEMSLSRAAGMKIATEVTETTNDDIADT